MKIGKKYYTGIEIAAMGFMLTVCVLIVAWGWMIVHFILKYW